MFCFVLFFCTYLCKKYYKPIIVQYYIADCVSWVPRLTLLVLKRKLDLWTHSQDGTHWYGRGDLLYYFLIKTWLFSSLKSNVCFRHISSVESYVGCQPICKWIFSSTGILRYSRYMYIKTPCICIHMWTYLAYTGTVFCFSANSCQSAETDKPWQGSLITEVGWRPDHPLR